MSIKSIIVIGAFMLPAFDIPAQVSIFTDPESDAIVFETYKATTIVIPKTPAYEVEIPSIFGTSSYYVSPGGFVSPTYEVNEDE